MYGLPWWLSDEEAACQYKRSEFNPGQEDPLEKEMVTHSSILAWEIPWTEEPGGLQSMGPQRVRSDWATEQQIDVWHVKRLIWELKASTMKN